MKVLMLNSSPHSEGTTATALVTAGEVLESCGIDTELFQIPTSPIRDCVACLQCRKNPGYCAFEDGKVNEFIDKAKKADGFLFGTPVYYAHPSGRVLSFLDRAFYANTAVFSHKPAAAIACARRAGTTATLDVLNKYFTIAQMPVVASTYWNMVHGVSRDDALLDREGIQTIENLARNMAWMLQCIETGKSVGILPPENPKKTRTNFIR